MVIHAPANHIGAAPPRIHVLHVVLELMGTSPRVLIWAAPSWAALRTLPCSMRSLLHRNPRSLVRARLADEVEVHFAPVLGHFVVCREGLTRAPQRDQMTSCDTAAPQSSDGDTSILLKTIPPIDTAGVCGTGCVAFHVVSFPSKSVPHDDQ